MKTSKRFYVAEGVVLRVNEVLNDLRNGEYEPEPLGKPISPEENRIHITAKCEQLLRELSYAGAITNGELDDLVNRIGDLPFKEKAKKDDE